MSKPSLAPMKTTIASGSSLATWLVESLPQSTKPLLEMPVPSCGWRSTFTLPVALGELSAPARRRAASTSSRRSPAACRARAAAVGSAPSAAGSNDVRRDRGERAAARRRAAAWSKPPASPTPSSVPIQSVAFAAHSSKGSWSATQPVGWPIGEHHVALRRPGPSPRRRRGSRRPRTAPAAPRSAARRRSPHGRSGAGRGVAWGTVSSTVATSELEVDEGGHGVAGNGCADERDRHGQDEPEGSRLQLRDAALAAASSGFGGSSCRPTVSTIAATTGNE